MKVLPEVAADTDLPRESWEEAKTATEALQVSFGSVDKAFHRSVDDGREAFDQVAGQIEASLAQLEALLPLAGEAAAADDAAADSHAH
ncbi:MAG: hypothetical protein AAGB00_04805 [Planctomycetota bacterium]